MAMKQRQALRRMKERAAAHGHPVWWVMAGIVVGVGGTAAALWRDADNEPRTALGVRVPGYLGTLVDGSASAASGRPTPQAPAAASQPAPAGSPRN